MARLRKFAAYQKIERPYTRTSKYKKKSYIKARPHSVLVRFNHGDVNGKFEKTFYLLAQKDIQIRQNALEAARQTSNRVLEKLGKNAYFMRIRKYPFHILRENPLASGAGADRMSTGMKMSFGKPIGTAAQVHVGDILFEVRVLEKDIKSAKLALQRASKKLPCSCRIVEAQSLKAKTGKTKKIVKLLVDDTEEPVESVKSDAVPTPAVSSSPAATSESVDAAF
jgi:large subunit ribosomal protein L10e